MLNMLKISQALAQRRPVFHSEADFQHAFAWEIYHTLPQARLRLEYPARVSGWRAQSEARFEIDIFAILPEEKVAIECKYKVAKLNAIVDQEKFDLASQQAQNEGAYDLYETSCAWKLLYNKE